MCEGLHFMDKKNLNSLGLFLVFLAVLVIVTVFLQHESSSGHIGSAVSGGVYLYHTTGLIEDIDYQKKTIEVADVDNSDDLFESDALHLDCTLDISAFKSGQRIKFYF